jgi:hypothetical protein
MPSLGLNWASYIALIVLLAISLALPPIKRMGAADIDVELGAPPAAGPVLSPSMLELKTKD